MTVFRIAILKMVSFLNMYTDQILEGILMRYIFRSPVRAKKYTLRIIESSGILYFLEYYHSTHQNSMSRRVMSAYIVFAWKEILGVICRVKREINRQFDGEFEDIQNNLRDIMASMPPYDRSRVYQCLVYEGHHRFF